MKLLISSTQTVLAQYFNLSQFNTILAPCINSTATQRSSHTWLRTTVVDPLYFEAKYVDYLTFQIVIKDFLATDFL